MPLFTSARERRLWLAALAVLAAIYSTLGPAVALAAALRQRNLLGVSVTAALLALAVLVVWRWAKTRPRRSEIGVALGVAAVYLWTLARIPIPEERTHLIEYSVVAAIIHMALLERRGNGRQVPYPALLAFAVTALLGWLDEGIQALLPNRFYDLRDVGFNVFAAFMAIAARVALAWVRRRRSG